MWDEDAEWHATRLGVQVNYAGQGLLGAFLNAGLDVLMHRGVPLPFRIVVDPARFERQAAPAVLLYAGFDLDDATIYVNSRSYFFGSVPESAKRIAEENFAIRYWSTDSPHHVLFHELGHELFARVDSTAFRRLRGEPLPDEAIREIGDRICRRAETGILEFVAEVFAALVAGEFVADEVLNWHRRFRGPEP